MNSELSRTVFTKLHAHDNSCRYRIFVTGYGFDGFELNIVVVLYLVDFKHHFAKLEKLLPSLSNFLMDPLFK